MDVVSDQVYLPTHARKRSRKAVTLVSIALWVFAYYVEKKTGILAWIWKHVVRYLPF